MIDMVFLVFFPAFLFLWKVFFETRKVVQIIFFRWCSCTLSSSLLVSLRLSGQRQGLESYSRWVAQSDHC